MDSKYGTITARWIRAIALSVGLDPRKTTIQAANDIAAVNNNVTPLAEFIPNG